MPAIKRTREERLTALIRRSLAGARKTQEVSDVRLCAEMGCGKNTLYHKMQNPEKMSVEQLFAIAPLIGLEIEIRPVGQNER
jgi:hypothetical protein